MKPLLSLCLLGLPAAATAQPPAATTTATAATVVNRPVIATISAADSTRIMSRRFAPLNSAALSSARARLVNPQWNYTLPAGRSARTGSAFTFAKNRPTVVVLIHGITGYPTTDPRIGTLKGARNYWGYDFVWGLFGAQTDKPSTFAADDAASTLGRPDWETRFVNDNNSAHHFITIYGKPKPDRNFYTPFSLMMTYRDGSEPMKKQVAQTAAQIVSLYEAQFGSWPADKQPQLILLGHSFGGLVARSICSSPEQVPSNHIDVATERFSAAERANMDFIRNRTVHITTLATPHEGSPITWNAAMGTAVQWLPGPGVQINETDPDTYVIRQLRTGFVRNLNSTILRPELCRRTDASLIPVHALGGRVPAGPEYFRNPNVYDNDLTTVDGGIGRTNIEDLLPGETNRDKFECYNLLRVDYAMHLFFGGNLLKPWGAVPEDNQALDIIRVRDVQPLTGCLTLPLYNLASFIAKPRLYYLRTDWDAVPHKGPALPGTCSGRFSEERGAVSDGEIDNDGFVPINSALGVKLGTDNKNYFDHAAGGSWYRFYRSGADFHNHGTIKFNEDVGKWLREHIIGNAVVPLVALHALGNTAAGPKVARDGERSSW